MKAAIAVIFISLAAYILIGPPKERTCSWEFQYSNTLQHDINRRWVCK